MKVLRWLLVTLFLYPFAIGVPLELSTPPTSYDKASVAYRFIQLAIFDLDEILKDVGISTYACRLDNGSNISYPGVGACIYESAKFTFKEKRASRILVWVLNDQSQYLPPLVLEWKNSHSGLLKFGGEFVFLAFEDFFGHLVRAANRVSTEKGSSPCSVANEVERDLGNFIGNLTITIPKGRKLSEYFAVKNFDGLSAEKIILQAETPYYLNKKRAYKVTAITQNEHGEGIQVSMLTNYNLISQRQACFKGSMERNFKSIDGELVP